MWDSNLTAIWFDYKVDWEQRLEKEGEALFEFLDTTSNKVLDLGCGTGRHAEFLANNGFTVWGADPGEAMIRYANEHISHPKITFLKMDAFDLEEWDECPKFDRVLLIGNVIPHWHCKNELLANLMAISSIMSENGRIMISLANYVTRENKDQEITKELSFQAKNKEFQSEHVFGKITDKDTYLKIRLRVREKGTEDWNHFEERTVNLTVWTIDDLIPLIEASGFKVLETRGKLFEQVMNLNETDTITLIAKKIE
jgi:2-polyprenyl-3-methyl-5-hydroxy-6-metoxy-1,4-benzoquinol methylase